MGCIIAPVRWYFCFIIKKYSIMTSIKRTDLIQVTGRHGGSTILTLTISGVSSIGDVFRQVRSSAPEGCGIMSLSLRNRTQGWTQQHNLVFRDAVKSINRRSTSGNMSIPSLFDCAV